MIAATSVPHGDILVEASKRLKNEGVTLSIIEVDDYIIPNRMLAEGQVDANYFQHKPYLDVQSEQCGYRFQILATVHIEPMGIYSKKIGTLDELGRGDCIAVPNDPTNERRALLLLAREGLIDFPCLPYPTVRDITSNPLGLRFEELDAPLLPRSLTDVTVAVIPSNFALMGHLDPNAALVQESADSPYANIVVIREGDDSPGLKKLSNILESKEISDFIREKYKGAILPTH